MNFTHTKKIILALTLLGAAGSASAQGIAGLEGAETAADGFASWLRGNLAKTVITIALAVLGYMAVFKNLSWLWVMSVLFGAFFIFGGPGLVTQLVSWFGGS